MKKCTYCGKEAPDDATLCPLDGEPVVDQAAPPAPKVSTTGLMIKGSLHAAAQDGDLERVNALLRDTPDLISKKSSWSPCGTPLHYAASNGRKDVTEFLLAHKADVNAKDNDGHTPLHSASQNGHEDLAKLLLANKANVNAKSNNGATPLLLVTKNGYREVAELLLANGADSTLKTYSRLPFIILLVIATVFCLFTFRGELGQSGSFIVIIGAIFGGWSLAKMNLPHFADQSGKRALLEAMKEGRLDTIAELLKNNKAEVNEKFEDRTTPLHWAASQGQKYIVELLTAHGADVNAKAYNGTTPLITAAFHGHKDVVEFLLAHGADVNVKADTGATALHSAAWNGHKEAAALLLASNADANAKANTGWIPLHSAAFHGRDEVVELLLANKADVNAKDNNSKTPLQLAVAKKHKQVVELLRQHGGHE